MVVRDISLSMCIIERSDCYWENNVIWLDNPYRNSENIRNTYLPLCLVIKEHMHNENKKTNIGLRKEWIFSRRISSFLDMINRLCPDEKIHDALKRLNGITKHSKMRGNDCYCSIRANNKIVEQMIMRYRGLFGLGIPILSFHLCQKLLFLVAEP